MRSVWAAMAETLFCTECGSVLEHLQHRFDELTETIKSQAIDIARRQSTINSLRRAQTEERPPEYDEAMEVAEHWRTVLAPRARELNGTRVQAVIARIKHFSKTELIKAIDGYAYRPNIRDGKRVRPDQGGKRWVELDLIMRDAKHVETGIEIYEAEMVHDASVLNAGGSDYVAQLCECGHSLVSHGLLHLQGHQACYERDCECRQFDDLPVRAEQWLTQKGYYDSRPAKKAPPPSEGQESLL
jgi:hypothetical protein